MILFTAKGGKKEKEYIRVLNLTFTNVYVNT